MAINVMEKHYGKMKLLLKKVTIVRVINPVLVYTWPETTTH